MSRIRILVAAVVAAVLLSLATGPPAFAHDELVASDPASGADLTAAPSQATLEFSAGVMTVGAATTVVDGDGRDWVAGAPVIDGGRVTVPLESGMPVAGYELRWRVVSSDGHPISGVIPFTVGGADPLVRTPAPAASDGGAASDDDERSAVSDTDQETQETRGALRIALIGAGGAAAAAALFAAVHLIRRRSRPRGDDTGTGSRDSAEPPRS